MHSFPPTRADIEAAIAAGKPVAHAHVREFELELPQGYARAGQEYVKHSPGTFPRWIWDLGDTRLGEAVRETWLEMHRGDLALGAKKIARLSGSAGLIANFETKGAWNESVRVLERHLEAMVKADSLFSALVASIGSQLEGYKEDLHVIDRKIILANPGQPFVHWTRRLGTCIQVMPSADAEGWPSPGEEVPYLFGMANRGKILKEAVSLGAYHIKRSEPNDPLTARYFDGVELKCVDLKEAAEVLADWGATVEAEWARQPIVPVPRPATTRPARALRVA